LGAVYATSPALTVALGTVAELPTLRWAACSLAPASAGVNPWRSGTVVWSRPEEQ
jgi:hypothetical protein